MKNKILAIVELGIPAILLTWAIFWLVSGNIDLAIAIANNVPPKDVSDNLVFIAIMDVIILHVLFVVAMVRGIANFDKNIATLKSMFFKSTKPSKQEVSSGDSKTEKPTTF